VHLWVCPVQIDPDSLARSAEFLSEDERARASGIGAPEARNRFVLARAAVRCIIGGVLDLPPGRLRFRSLQRGKPVLAGPGARRLRFNSTHSGDLVLVAVSEDRDVGVDVERIRPIRRAEELAGRFISHPARVLPEGPAPARDEALLRWWTMREAYAKATGRGLGATRGHLRVSQARNDLMSISLGDREPNRWFARQLRPIEGYVAAVVADGCDWDLSISWLGVHSPRHSAA
jgi:4'-phosphopantetheinyl transferase